MWQGGRFSTAFDRTHASAAKAILKYAGRRIRDDVQNARRCCGKMEIPKEVADGDILPLLKQNIFPPGMCIDSPKDTSRLQFLREVKKFIELFGDVDDFSWPDLSEELEQQANRW